MKTLWKLALNCLMVSGFSSTTLPAADATMPLHAKAVVNAVQYRFDERASEQEKKHPFYVLHYTVVLTNRGKAPLRVSAGDFRAATDYGPRYIKAVLIWELPDPDEKGVITVSPETELKLTTLRPNEAVTLRWEETLRHLSRLDHVEIKLRVSEAFGKRYDVWSGELDVADLKVYCEGKPVERPWAEPKGSGRAEGVKPECLRSQPGPSRRGQT
jgi:hypothetical protein